MKRSLIKLNECQIALPTSCLYSMIKLRGTSTYSALQFRFSLPVIDHAQAIFQTEST